MAQLDVIMAKCVLVSCHFGTLCKLLLDLCHRFGMVLALRAHTHLHGWAGAYRRTGVYTGVLHDNAGGRSIITQACVLYLIKHVPTS